MAGGKRFSAVDGRVIDSVSLEQALAVVRRHPAAAGVQSAGTVDRDQWSVTARFDPARQFFLVSLGDADGTELYVSSRSGEIVLDTTRTERIWNWLGSIPHWIYPTLLRQDGPLWRQVVLWISGICMLAAVSGIWIGGLRVRLRRRYSGGSITPYRGWMAWHHVTGFFAGMFVLTWIFSGWLSLDPGEFFAGRGPSREMALRYAGHDAPNFPWLLAWRPAWDIVVWLLSLLGLTISVSGIVIGWRADFYIVPPARSATLALCRFCGMLISNALRSATALWNCSSAILKAVNAPSSMAPCSKHCSVSRRIPSASVCIWSSSSVESLRRAAPSMFSNRSRNELLLLRSSFFR
jgi:hypothetical protein